ncbi:MAG: S8 family serine peptidase [Nitrosomonas sp.]|nr:S8 family serine peptidase [Nitrosomonas sp.]
MAAPPVFVNQDLAIQSPEEDLLLEKPHAAKRNDKEDWAKGRILVMPRAGLPAKAFANILKEHQGKAKKIGQSELYIVELPEYSEEGVIARLKHHPHLKFAELDYLVTADLASNDPYYPNAWHLPKISAPSAWDSSQGLGVTIAILDTGIDGAHPDLASRLVPGWNFYDNNSNTSDVHGHGTKVAGAAAATTNNSSGVAGVAGQAKIMPIRVASPSLTASSSLISSGIIYAADRGVRVANVSYANQPMRSATITASQYMKDKGGLVTVSAGNNGIDEGFTPTNTMIPVSATDSNDVKTSWSSYGNYVAVAAPGSGIWTTVRGGTYGAVSGTSFSSPITAGVIALMMAANPKLKSTEIEKLLLSTAKDLGAAGRDSYYGYGRVDAAAAVKAAKSSVTTADITAPVVSITDPLSGETVSGLVPVSIQVSDNVGVTRTELWVNNTSVAVDTSAPYGFSWDSKGSSNGTASLFVRAYDAAGNVGISSTTKVNVSNQVITQPSDTTAPIVKIINPVAGNVSGNVTITVNASDNSGASGISLAIYIDNVLKIIGNGSTLSTNWNTRSSNVTAGSHIIKTIAKDAAGNLSTTSVTVKVIK